VGNQKERREENERKIAVVKKESALPRRWGPPHSSATGRGNHYIHPEVQMKEITEGSQNSWKLQCTPQTTHGPSMYQGKTRVKMAGG
jgi:hypothetical protein